MKLVLSQRSETVFVTTDEHGQEVPAPKPGKLRIPQPCNGNRQKGYYVCDGVDRDTYLDGNRYVEFTWDLSRLEWVRSERPTPEALKIAA